MTIPSGSILATALVSGLLLGGLFAVTALGLSLVFGVMRLVNLAHGELLVLGAYLALELSRHAGLDPLLTIPVVAAVLFVLAVPVQRVLLEPLMSRGGTLSRPHTSPTLPFARSRWTTRYATGAVGGTYLIRNRPVPSVENASGSKFPSR